MLQSLRPANFCENAGVMRAHTLESPEHMGGKVYVNQMAAYTDMISRVMHEISLP